VARFVPTTDRGGLGACAGGEGIRQSFLDFAPPCLTDEDIAEVEATLRSGWITTGPRVRQFEQAFAAALGARDAIAVNSATAALHVALLTAGVGAGDVVITTPMTFCSTVNVIEHVGARPLLVDVEEDTLNIDPRQIERAIEDLLRPADAARGAVRAILPVHLYGHPCDMEPIDRLAEARGLAIIEDAAHALPAKYRGRTIGAGDTDMPRRFTCFSFYATKNLTTGEGGMLIAPVELMEDARLWTLHGMSRGAYKRYTAEGSWLYDVVRAGFKYNMPDVQAALGLHQLRRLPAIHARRREIARRYNEAFAGYEELQTPADRDDVQHAWHIYALRLRPQRFRTANGQPDTIRRMFVERLHARNIGTSVHFIPIHLLRYYRDKYGYRPEDFPVAFDAYTRLVSLPLWPRMTDADVEDVIAAVRDVIETWDP
jgi:dTDP-4-amino-4,6-dideoxygalactose transaminase